MADKLLKEDGDKLLLESGDFLLLEDVSITDKVFPWLRPPITLSYLIPAARQPLLVHTVPLITEQIWRWITDRYRGPRWVPQQNFPIVPRIFRTNAWDTPPSPGGSWAPMPTPIGSGDWDCPPAMDRTAWEHGCCPLCGSLVIAYACGTCGAGLPNVTPCPNGYVDPIPEESLATRLRLFNNAATAIFPYTDLTTVELLTQVTESTTYAQYDLLYLECGQNQTLCVGIDTVSCTSGGNPEWEFVEFMQPISRAVLHGLDYGHDLVQIATIATGDSFDGRLFTVSAPEGRLFGFRLTNLDPTSLDPGDDCQATAIATDDCDTISGPPVDEPEGESRGTRGFLSGFEEDTPTLTELGWEFNKTLVNVVRSGIDTTTSVYLPDAASRNRKDIGVSATASEPLYARGYFKFTATPLSGGEDVYELIGVDTTGGSNIYSIHLLVNANNVSGRYRLNAKIGGGGETVNSTRGTYDMSQDTWYRIEFEMIRGADPLGTLTVRLYLGDTETLLEEIIETGSSDIAATYFKIGHTISGGSHDVDYWFDDIAVAPGGWIGPGTVHTIPALSERSVQWTPDGAYTNLEAIEGVPGTGVDTGTRNKTATVGHTDRYRLPVTGLDISKKVNFTQVMLRGAHNNAGAGPTTVRSKEWDNLGVAFDGVDYPVTFAVFNTNNALTEWNDIPVLQFHAFNVGYEASALGGNTAYVYNLWYQVNIH